MRGTSPRTGSPRGPGTTSRSTRSRSCAALGLAQSDVQGLGRLRDRTSDAARGLVAGDGQGAALVAEPGLAQRVGEERKSAGLAFDLPDQQVGQPVLEDEPVLARGRLDGLAQRHRRHRAEQEQAPLDQHGQPRGVAARSPVWSARRASTTRPRTVWATRASKNRPRSSSSLAQGEGLLGLVDEHDRVRSHSGGGERVHRVAARGEHDRVGAVASKRRGQPGAQQGGLAAARRSDDGQQPDRGQPLQAAPRLVLAAEERLRVLLAVRREPGVRRDVRRARASRPRPPTPGPGAGSPAPARPGPDRGPVRDRGRGRPGPGGGYAVPPSGARRGTAPGPATPNAAPGAVRPRPSRRPGSGPPHDGPPPATPRRRAPRAPPAAPAGDGSRQRPVPSPRAPARVGRARGPGPGWPRTAPARTRAT